MKTAKTATKNTKNTISAVMKGEKAMMNYTTMKKADLVALLTEKDTKIQELSGALSIANYTLNRYEALMGKYLGGEEQIQPENHGETAKNAPAKTRGRKKVADEPVVEVSNVKKTVKPEDSVKTVTKPVEKAAQEPVKEYEHKYIAPWRLKKYGSVEKCIAVDEAAKIVAQEWADQKRKTGKNVVPYNEYKTRLYEEAERRVNEAEAAAAKATKTTKKGGKR